jgi:transposase, IS30 family
MAGARLTQEERVRIEVLWSQGMLLPQIAEQIGRHRSTVWREVARNHSGRHGRKHPAGRRHGGGGRGGSYRWGYQAHWAQAKADQRALRPKRARCAPGGSCRVKVLELLGQRWSPRQIERRLRLDHPDQPEQWVSHETIYQAIYVQGRGNLRAELGRQVALRSGRARCRPARAAGGAVRSARPWAGNLHISTRPAEVTDRAVPGHWEGDLVVGARSASAIITLVERSTRYVLLGALPDGRASEAVVHVLSQLAGRLPEHLWRSLTWDNGSELAQHATFTVASGCPVYFCDPHSPWQRGSNENTNGLLRQYFPKGQTDFRTVTQADLDAVAVQLNGRPRQTLEWRTPAERLAALVAPAA